MSTRGLAIALLLLVGGVMVALFYTRYRSDTHLAFGQRLYAEHCAACHGSNLEGEPDWRYTGPDGMLPAPPHDASGHTWHHADKLLLAIIRQGTAAFVGGGYESNMPGFAEILTEAEIQAVLDYIKSSWPQEEAEYQRRMSRN